MLIETCLLFMASLVKIPKRDILLSPYNQAVRARQKERDLEMAKIILTTVGFEPTLFRTSIIMHQVNLKLAP